MESKTNEQVLSMDDERITFSNTIDVRRGKMVGHLIRRDSFVRTIKKKDRG